MKTIAEIADEYERNLAVLRARRDALTAQRAAERSFERRRGLTLRILALNHCMYSSMIALGEMRGYLNG